VTPVYRMVHSENLPKLLEWGGDYAPNQCEARSLTKKTIHHAHIMDRRQSRTVTCGAGGTLADYVPFYFRYCSPMLYAINRGQVAGCSGPRDIVFLQTTAERVAKAKVPFAFTNGHAVIAYSEFFDDLADLDKVPWDAVRAKYWNNHIDGKFKCQAEFLVRDFFSLELVEKIGVYDEAMLEQTSSCLQDNGCNVIVSTEQSWYF
jgi:hypothetical protein